jgi:hypothetical protein
MARGPNARAYRRLRRSIGREAKAHARMKDASGKTPPGDRRGEERNASRLQEAFEDNVRARLTATERQKTQTSKSRARTNDAKG